MSDAPTISFDFVKMHGAGNDYVYVDGFTHHLPDPAAVSVRVSDRHTGIGGDGLILVLPANDGVDAHCRMRMFNADGSEGDMCGNGIRCVCKFAVDHRLFPGVADAKPLRVQTNAGVKVLDYTLDAHGKVETVTVDMGEPSAEPAQVPVHASRLHATDAPHTFTFEANGTTYTGTFVNTGNPHVAIYVPDVGRVDLERVGPALEHHPAFPRRMNVHFVQVIDETTVRVRHWERGSGITLACGTGACAVCVAGVLTGKGGRALTAMLPGGDLKIVWRESDQHVYMTGPAVEVFTGRFTL